MRRDVQILLATMVTLVLRRPIAVDRSSGRLTRRGRRDRRQRAGDSLERRMQTIIERAEAGPGEVPW